MLRKLFTALLLLPFLSFAQETKTTSSYEISGTIYSTSIYQGPIYYDDSEAAKVPLSNHTMYLIRWTDDEKIPIVISKFSTDKSGRFKLKVSEGQYGFAMPEEIDSLKAGQWLPNSTHSWIGHYVYNSYWEISGAAPVNVSSASATNLVLVCNRVTTCIDCQ